MHQDNKDSSFVGVLILSLKAISYMTMTPFYQVRSREHEKSENGLHGKSRICPGLYRFFWYTRSKNLLSNQIMNDDVSVNGFSLFSMQLATCFIVVLISLEIICHSQGQIHANPPKNEGKVLFRYVI